MSVDHVKRELIDVPWADVRDNMILLLRIEGTFQPPHDCNQRQIASV